MEIKKSINSVILGENSTKVIFFYFFCNKITQYNIAKVD